MIISSTTTTTMMTMMDTRDGLWHGSSASDGWLGDTVCRVGNEDSRELKLVCRGCVSGLYTMVQCCDIVSGHTTQSAPALIRTPKLSCVGLG